MGFQYDYTDTAPLDDEGMSTLDGYISGPVWSGAEGAQVIINPTSNSRPPGALCTDLDSKRLDKDWYAYISTAGLTTHTNIDLAIGNMYVPARLCYSTSGGASTTAIDTGKVFIVATMDLIEPTLSSLST